MLKGIIFDLDGVLIHSMPLHVTAWQRYLARLGIEVEDLEQRMHGKRNPELVQDLIGADLADDVAPLAASTSAAGWRSRGLLVMANFCRSASVKGCPFGPGRAWGSGPNSGKGG